MRSGWKALLAGGVAGLAVAAAASGCGESKEPTKAQTDSQLKPLPPPSSPGGGGAADPVGKGGKKTSAGASASGASSQ
jgi:hypothetical protein